MAWVCSASLGRIELLLVTLAASGLMLAWSKPWLERYRYGPLEWVWRSLTHWRVEQVAARIAASPGGWGERSVQLLRGQQSPSS
jgi:hypothetical protein